MTKRHVTRRELLEIAGTALIGLPLMGAAKDTARPPNFIIVLADDQGYGDLGCFGSPQIKTPRIDRMAREGMRFTNFYAQTVCGPSRAALMTGCYPLRVAKRKNEVSIHPFLHDREITIAETLREVGYTSGCFGKWDLAGHSQKGYDPKLLPTRQGFDTFFGTPTSNDQIVNLLRDEEVIEQKADMSLLVERYTDVAIEFIKSADDKPFFVYLPHTMPHTIIAASKKFRGTSERGLYGDVIEEIDWNVGRILDTVAELGLDESTYVIYTSDNGPWFKKGDHGGSPGPLRGAKTSTWEGGLRVPCVMRAPGRIAAGKVCDEIASTMDLHPTLAKLAGTNAPTDRIIDGHDIAGLIHGKPGAKSPTQAYYFYKHTQIQAVRAGKWKLHVARTGEEGNGHQWDSHIAKEDVIEFKAPRLYDLESDIAESNDVAAKHPEVVDRLLALVEEARDDIGDHNRVGKGARFFDEGPPRADIGAKPKAKKSKPKAKAKKK